MIGLTFISKKEGSSLGFKEIKITGRYVYRYVYSEYPPSEDQIVKKIKAPEYYLEAICDGLFCEFEQDQLTDEIIYGYYELKPE